MADDRKTRVLILEDEWMIAQAIKETLLDADYQVVGPVNSVARALEAIEREPIDAAVLDVWLGQGDSFSFAEMLARRNTPFLFTTGYSTTDFPEQFRDAVLVGKPVEPKALLSALRGLLA